MTSLITEEIKSTLFNAVFIKLKEHLEMDDEVDNEIMEHLIIENPSTYISYALLDNILQMLDIDQATCNELAEYVRQNIFNNKFNQEFQNYATILSVKQLK